MIKKTSTQKRTPGSLHPVVKQPGAARSTIKKLIRLYRKLCETHPDPRVQRIAQGMESALRYATEDTQGWKMTEEPVLLARCLVDDLKAA